MSHHLRGPAAAQRVLTGLPADRFDCMQVNLAVLADLCHGTGTHAELGAPLQFRPCDDPLPSVEPDLLDHLTDAQRTVGITAESGAAWDTGDVHYVVADAHDLPWTPYNRRQHMRHSFLAWQTEPGRLDVVDAYHNDTSWGAARPVRTELSIVDLPTDAEAFRIGAEPLVAPDVTLVRKANERELAEALDDGVVDRFARAYRDHDDRQAAATAFTLQTWLLARSRALHELWLRRHDEDATAFAKHVECWRRFAERAFIAARRAQRGRRAPADLHDELTELLRLDREHAAPADDAPAHSRAEVTRLVTDTAAMVLAVDAPTLAAVVDLAELPTFNSFRVVALVEQLEDVLGVELDAAVLIPHNLHSLDRLCDLFVDATREDTR